MWYEALVGVPGDALRAGKRRWTYLSRTDVREQKRGIDTNPNRLV